MKKKSKLIAFCGAMIVGAAALTLAFINRDFSESSAVAYAPNRNFDENDAQKPEMFKRNAQETAQKNLTDNNSSAPIFDARTETSELRHEDDLENPLFYLGDVGLDVLSAPQQLEADRWLRQRGYHVVMAGCAVLEGEQDYCAMSADYLRSVAEAGDVDAQLLLGLKFKARNDLQNSETATAQAEAWFERAVVEGEYLVALNHIATLYYNQAVVLETDEFYRTGLQLHSDSLSKFQHNGYVWANVSMALGDHIANQLLADWEYAELDSKAKQAIEAEARQVLVDINAKRHALGLSSLDATALPEQIATQLPL